MKRTSGTPGERAGLRAAVDELFSTPPDTLEDLLRRVRRFPRLEVCRELVARIAEGTLGKKSLIAVILLSDLGGVELKGDLVALVENGRKDMSVRAFAFLGLANMAPEEIERLLESQPDVADAAAELVAEVNAAGREQRNKRGDSRVCTIKVSIRHVKPPIWRRIEVEEETYLDELHDIIQIAMGWDDKHLHMFRTRDANYSIPYVDSDDVDSDDDDLDERDVTIGDLIADDVRKFVYEYDFGDEWEHEIVIEKVEDASPGARLPRCVKGKRACPVEDSGGPYGYMQLLEALANRRHRGHKDAVEWIGSYDAERFDLDEINAALAEWAG